MRSLIPPSIRIVMLATLVAAAGRAGVASERIREGGIDSFTYATTAPSSESAALRSVPGNDKEKLGWVLWLWNDQSRSDPGQTFQTVTDMAVTGVSVLFASSENLDGEKFSLCFERFGDIEKDVKPAEPPLAVYRGRLPDDFDRQSPGKWVTFRLNRPMPLKGGRGYAFRLGFDQERDYDLRRAFIRASGTDEAGQPISTVNGRLTRRIGEQNYSAWGSIEDMFFVLRTDPSP